MENGWTWPIYSGFTYWHGDFSIAICYFTKRYYIFFGWADHHSPRSTPAFSCLFTRWREKLIVLPRQRNSSPWCAWASCAGELPLGQKRGEAEGSYGIKDTKHPRNGAFNQPNCVRFLFWEGIDHPSKLLWCVGQIRYTQYAELRMYPPWVLYPNFVQQAIVMINKTLSCGCLVLFLK